MSNLRRGAQRVIGIIMLFEHYIHRDANIESQVYSFFQFIHFFGSTRKYICLEVTNKTKQILKKLELHKDPFP